jgi:uncharacterized cupredoxin-like copper-binding protein
MEFNDMLVVFPAGSQEKPYGLPTNASASPSPTAVSGATNGTAPANGTGSGGKPVAVKLLEWAVEPAEYKAELSDKLAVTVTNEGQQLHNLYVGSYDPANADHAGAKWFTEDIPAGASANLSIELPSDPGAWEWWCNVPGHYGLGMHGVLTTGGVLGERPKPLLPGFELPMALAAALGVAFFAARRRQ